MGFLQTVLMGQVGVLLTLAPLLLSSPPRIDPLADGPEGTGKGVRRAGKKIPAPYLAQQKGESRQAREAAEPPEVEAGSPPLITDDPDTPDRGEFELNFLSTLSLHEGGHSFEHLVDANYGVTGNIQLTVEMPYVSLHENGATTASGFGNAQVGAKLRFRESGPFAISVYPQVAFGQSEDAHAVVDGIAQSKNEYSLPFQVSYQDERTRFKVIGDLGNAWDSTGDRSWLGGLGLGVPVSKNVSLMGDLWVEGIALHQVGRSTLTLAEKYEFNDRLFGFVSVGRTLSHPVDESSTTTVMVGFQIIP